MHRLIRRLGILILAASLASCTTDVFGPYAKSISTQDIQQIKELIAARPDIHKFILRVTAARPDCVYVETAPTVIDQPFTSFLACRRHGKWHIKEGSVEKWRVVVTS